MATPNLAANRDNFKPRSVQEQVADAQAKTQFADLLEKSALDDLGIAPLSWWHDRAPPCRDWMVEGLFLRGTVGLIAGDGGVGKSLICQQLVTCATMGKPWLGKIISAGKALYMACEDSADELWRRQVDINRHYGVEMLDLSEGGLQLWPRVGQDNSLMYLERSGWKMARTELLDRLALRCSKHGIQYVVIDTATQTFRGNQNDEIQVMDFITELRKLAVRIQGIVLLTKHPSLSGRALGTGESGNTAWTNSVRSRCYLHKDKSGQLMLDVLKSNYGPRGDGLPLKWSDGVYVLDVPEESYSQRYY
jgi:RecA-family ATPase